MGEIIAFPKPYARREPRDIAEALPAPSMEGLTNVERAVMQTAIELLNRRCLANDQKS